MATVNKDFKIKSGLIVEGTTATVNGYDVLTKKQADQDYVVNLIGGTATSANEANKVVKRDANGNFAAGTITADVTGQVSDISNHNTSSLSEGNLNLYFTNQRALDATSAAYDAVGSAAAVASDLSDHVSDTSAHGVTGNVVGTSDTQTLTNKTIGDTLNFTGAGAMTINSDSHIVLTPAAGSSVKWGADILATQGYADQAEADANAYTDTAISTEVTNRNSAITTAIGTEVTDRNSAIETAKGEAMEASYNYTDAGIAGLVDSAPELLDTLNELAAAIADNPNYATDVANLVATKADTSYVDSEISDLDTVAQGYASAAQAAAQAAASADAISKANAAQAAAEATASADATSKASTAELNAIAYADALTTSDIAEGTNLYFTNQRAIDAVGGTIGDQIDLLDTDDIEEGSTNLYFTDARAKDSAGDLLAGADTDNVNISFVGGILTITAENGVADSTTDDLDEGINNLYFTPTRAVDAIEAVVPNFTEVELNSVAKQVAAALSAPTAGTQVAHAFAKADYRSAEYLVRVAYGTHTEISKVLLTLDSSDNIAITEYGIVGTNGSASSISAGISGSNVQLQVTTANNNSTITVVGTLVA